MIIRFDENLNISATEEESIVAGNNNVNEIKIFMYEGFDFSANEAYLNFELSDGEQFNNRPTTKQFKLNEKGIEEEQCYYYVMPKYLLKQPGRLKLTMRISPLFEIRNIENSSLITTQIYFAVFENGEEIIDPETTELLRQEIANVQISTNATARQYVEDMAASGAFKGDTGPQGPIGPIGPPGKTIEKTSELINDGDGNSPFATQNDVKKSFSDLINSAPESLDTLGEIAKVLAENKDVIEALNQAIGTKANKSDLINMLNYKGETTEDNVGNLLNAVGDLCYVTGTREYRLCVESTLVNGHLNKTFMPIVAEVDLSKFVSSETFNDLLNNRINISNDSSGGAIGYGASAGKGFAGGQNAKTTQKMESGATRVVDAIQLGTGTNLQDRTLQVYDDNIYDATTHTAKFQNITLNGEDLQEILANIQPKITVDTSVSSTSTNPVQNKAIYNYIEDVKNSIDSNNLANMPINNYNSNVLDLDSLSAPVFFRISSNTCAVVNGYSSVTTLTKGDIVIANPSHAFILELTNNKEYNMVMHFVNIVKDVSYSTHVDGSLLTDKDVSAVAISGSYNDLINKPTNLATTDYVDTAVANLVDSAPDTLNTLGEIATALKENENVVETLNEAITNKANTSDLENYLPLTAGIDKKMTGDLYFDNNKFIKGYTTASTSRNLIGVNTASVIELGDVSANINVKAASAFRPATNNVTVLGTSALQWKEIYGTTIYQNGKQVANAEDIPDTSGLVPNTRTVNGKSLSSNISLGNKDVGALPDYTLTINHGTAGNPRMVKFASVNYSSAATCFKMGAMTCHDNGVSYQFLTDMLIAVTTAGEVTANIYKFAQSSIGNVDGVTRYTGDVFYVNDTTNKIVDFYILCGQYSSSQFTPATKVGSTTIANVTQYSGNATYYSSGTKTWVNGCGGTYARTTELGTQATFSLSGTTLTITPK